MHVGPFQCQYTPQSQTVVSTASLIILSACSAAESMYCIVYGAGVFLSLTLSNVISLHLEEVTLVIIVRDFFRDALIACLEIVNQL